MQETPSPVKQLDRLTLKMLTDCKFFKTPGGCKKYTQMNKRQRTTVTENSTNNQNNENTVNEDDFNPEKNCAFRHPKNLHPTDVCTKWMKFKTCDNVNCPKRHLPQEPHYTRRIPKDLTEMCRKGDECKNPVCCYKHPVRWINGFRYKEDDKDFKIPHKVKSTVTGSSVAGSSVALGTNLMSEKIVNDDVLDLMEF